MNKDKVITDALIFRLKELRHNLEIEITNSTRAITSWSMRKSFASSPDVKGFKWTSDDEENMGRAIDRYQEAIEKLRKEIEILEEKIFSYIL